MKGVLQIYYLVDFQLITNLRMSLRGLFKVCTRFA